MIGMLILSVSIIIFVLYYQKKILKQKSGQIERENEYQRELLRASIEIEERERERIAKNIHDDIGATLNFLKLQLYRAERNPDYCKEVLPVTIHVLDDTIGNIRRIARDLMPPTLVKLGLEKGLSDFFKNLSFGDKNRIEIHGHLTISLEPKSELQLYRIILEIVNNIIKHSDAQKIIIHLANTENEVQIKIKYKGTGINDQEVQNKIASSNGLGLKSIQSRILLLNGKISYNVTNSKLSSVHIFIPVNLK